MSAAPDPLDPALVPPTPEISDVAQLARDRLHEEIERVRTGVEEMIDDQEAENGKAEDLRQELERLRVETRDLVKKRVRKSEKRLEKSVREIGARTDELEQRIDEVEHDREIAEARIHHSTEEMLDSLLSDVRLIADRLAGLPQPPPSRVGLGGIRKPMPEQSGPAASEPGMDKPEGRDSPEAESSKPRIRRRPFRK